MTHRYIFGTGSNHLLRTCPAEAGGTGLSCAASDAHRAAIHSERIRSSRVFDCCGPKWSGSAMKLMNETKLH